MRGSFASSGCVMSSLMLSILALGGCVAQAGDDQSTEQVETVVSDIVGQPLGLTCGVAYTNGSPVVDGACMGVRTLGGTPAFNYHIAFQGDFGLSSGQGFYSQNLSFSGGDVSQPDFLELPKGTACGFKHSCQTSQNETCLGHDPFTDCPIGWTQRFGSDLNAPGGCIFAWCEYTDPHNVCTTSTCEVTNVPLGLACGISDNDVSVGQQGQCLGGLTINGCPAGYVRHGFFDDGRSGGHGIGWCARENTSSGGGGGGGGGCAIHQLGSGSVTPNSTILCN